MKTESHPLGVLTWNTHKGIALRDGGLDWLLDRTNPHIICLQEVDHVETLRSALRRSGRSADWNIIAPHEHYERGLPFILARPKRFQVRWTSAPNIRLGSKHNRRRTSAGLYDRRTDRLVIVASVHVDPLGAGFEDANLRARSIHEEQVQEYADLFQMATVNAPEAVKIAAGDYNEHLAEPIQFQMNAPLGRRTATQRMGRAGMYQARTHPNIRGSREVRLDEVFTNHYADHVRVVKRRVLTPEMRSNDHSAVMARLMVDLA